MTVCANTDAVFPYQFNATPDINDPSKTVVVTLVMPVGGKETGFFRYPKAGEEVLVDDDSKIMVEGDAVIITPAVNYYLMGYLSSATDANNNFLSNTKPVPVEGEDGYSEEQKKLYDTQKGYFDTEVGALRDGEAMVLRYEQTGKNTPEDGKDERYSEIGFYRKETQWRTSNTDYKGVPQTLVRNKDEGDKEYSERLKTADFPKADDESDANYIYRVTTAFPKIDRLNIQSSGDMRAVAKNYQLLKANRFELLVNTSDTIHDQKELDRDDLPLGDNPGDDSALHAGDAHIRAGNRVVIKAGEEIILQVGKTAVKISDGALDVISKMVDSNFTNAYDTTFSMSGSGGITMYGRNVKINADTSLDLGDTYGGSLSSALGVVSIGGREIKVAGYDSVRYALLVGNAAAQYIQAITSGSMGINGNVTNQLVDDYIKFSTNLLIHGAQLAAKIVDAYRTIKKYVSMGKGLRKEKEEEEAKTKEEMAKKKMEKADTEEGQAKTAMETKKQAVVNATTDCKNKTDAYNQAKKDYEAATGPDKDAKRDAMNDAYKDLEKSYQGLSKAKDEEREATKAHEDSVKSKKIAQDDYDRAHTKYEKAQKETVSAWSSEIKKKTGATPATAAPPAAATTPPAAPAAPSPAPAPPPPPPPPPPSVPPPTPSVPPPTPSTSHP
jgi:hypothetical protein